MLAIIDYGLGNLTSVANALNKLTIPNQISNRPEVIQQATGLILPGVGAAGEGMKNLAAKKLNLVIKNQMAQGKPILGICLGMQLLFSTSDESNVDCLDIIKGQVKKFEISLKVPQMGWNQVKIAPQSKLFKGIKNESNFYFVHSYYCDPKDPTIMIGTTNYGQNFASAIETNSVFGVQFHPEKSGDAGLQLLKNFSEVIC